MVLLFSQIGGGGTRHVLEGHHRDIHSELTTRRILMGHGPATQFQHLAVPGILIKSIDCDLIVECVQLPRLDGTWYIQSSHSWEASQERCLLLGLVIVPSYPGRGLCGLEEKACLPRSSSCLFPFLSNNPLYYLLYTLRVNSP